MQGDVLHVVWNCNRQLHHALRTPDGWRQVTPIAIGEQPALALAPDGVLHCLFVNQFARNYEIYHVWRNDAGWSLPVNVSRTFGASSQPALAIGADGVLHAAWTDTTPGYPTVYYATRAPTAFFWSVRPVPSGRGAVPAIAVAPSGAVAIAWQDRRSDTDAYDIFSCTYSDDTWLPPQSVSDSAGSSSLSPKLAATAQGDVHMVWQEESMGQYRILHASLGSAGWTMPIEVSQSAGDCRLAQIAANESGFVHAAWVEGETIHLNVRSTQRDEPWRATEAASEGCYGIDGLALAVSSLRESHIIWCALDQADDRQLFYARREPFPKYTTLLPIAVG
jgi:hypothetical protein